MERDSKEQLLRIAVSNDMLTLDEQGQLPGRGAYLHYDNGCITSFANSRIRKLRSLKRNISRDERRKFVELIHARLDSCAAVE